jgi:hypothetical protein
MNSKVQTLQESVPVDHRNPCQTSLFLKPSQLLGVVPFSVLLWFVAAIFIQSVKGIGIFGGTNGVLTFLALISISWVSVLAIRLVGGLRKGKTISGVTVGLATATFLAAVALI